MGVEPFDAIIHLAAKAGVRPSIKDPVGNQRANVIATQNLLEFAKDEVINLGNDQTVTLSEMIATIEEVVGNKAIIDRQPEQPGDVPQTWSDVSKAKELFGYEPSITFKEGVEQFYKWQKAQSNLF